MTQPRSAAAADRFVFGAGRIHHLPLRSQRLRLIGRALDAGFEAFDVAPVYGDGLNELELGVALARRPDVRINTKFGIPFEAYGERNPALFPVLRIARLMWQGPHRADYLSRELTPHAMATSLEQSLRRLKMDCVDHLFIHEPLAPIGDAQLDDLAASAERLRTEGKIRAFGIAGPALCMGAAGRHAAIAALQLPLTDVAGMSAAPGKRLMAYGVYRHYAASRTQRPGSFDAFVREHMARRRNLDMVLSSLSLATVGDFAGLINA